jgi:phospholipid-binding lipoprotein MlaA
MEEAALDRYEFIRDGFLQRRASRIDDGGGKAKFKQFMKKNDAPADAKSIKAAYPDDPGPTGDAAPASPAAPNAPAEPNAPADAKAIRAAYPDDPGPTPDAPADKTPVPAPAVSSEPPAK